MNNTTGQTPGITTTSGAADLLDLIEAYAEARHRQGHSSYNAQTATALQAVKDALAAGQATAAQQGVAYAALPEYGINTASHAHFRVLGFTADQMRAFADATHTMRASHGQAPSGAGEAAEHYRNAIARARLLDSDLSNLTERGAKAWAGVDAQGLRDGGASHSANAVEPSAHIKEPYTLAEIKAKIASNDYSAEMLLQHAMLLLDSAQEDAARYRYLRDGDWREHEKLESVIRLQLNALWDETIDASRKQGGAV